ncbi:MAG: GNAT family N-acetyltransferase [Phycisphaerae bacterium]|jgi:GNAT superfamily N-acetyltransferase
MLAPMQPQPCTATDFAEILRDLTDFWGSDRARAVHHPMFLHEFGDTAWVIRDAGRVVAYLFGFIAQTTPTGYVHLLAVRPEYRGRGLARRLYAHFTEFAIARGCRALKAITSPHNHASIAFHRSIGMQLDDEANEHGVPVVRDYAGPGQDRVVFRKAIGPQSEPLA